MWNMLDLEKATLTQVKLVSPLDRRMLSYLSNIWKLNLYFPNYTMYISHWRESNKHFLNIIFPFLCSVAYVTFFCEPLLLDRWDIELWCRIVHSITQIIVNVEVWVVQTLNKFLSDNIYKNHWRYQIHILYNNENLLSH